VTPNRATKPNRARHVFRKFTAIGTARHLCCGKFVAANDLEYAVHRPNATCRRQDCAWATNRLCVHAHSTTQPGSAVPEQESGLSGFRKPVERATVRVEGATATRLDPLKIPQDRSKAPIMTPAIAKDAGRSVRDDSDDVVALALRPEVAGCDPLWAEAHVGREIIDLGGE
jgi:hypothetical protein